MQRRSTLAVLLAAGSAMAWALVFLTPGDDLAFPWLQVTLALVIIVAAAAVAVGKIRLPVAFLATWLPLGLLGVWNVATSDALGAVGAVAWLAVSAIVTGAVVVTVAMIKNSANRPVHNTPKPE